MKTLKQLYKQIADSMGNLTSEEAMIATEKWLTQKHLKPNTSKTLIGYQVSTINIFIDELLEEIKNDI